MRVLKVSTPWKTTPKQHTITFRPTVENCYFPVRVRARRFRLARQVWLSRPAPACSFSTLRLNLVLTYGIPPAFRGGVIVHLFIPPTAIGSVSSLPGHAIAYRWRSLPRVRRHSASSPQGIVVPVAGAAFSGVSPWTIECAPLFSHTLQTLELMLLLLFKEKSERT